MLRQRIGNMKMERKLLISFILLVSVPLIAIGYYSSQQYEQSIKQKTIDYSMKIQESNMVRIDDYIQDMISISSIPVYIDDLKSNLIRSNDYYAKRQMINNQQSIPQNFSQLLSIQRGIESELSFINTIKRGENSVYLFDAYGNSYFSIVAGDIRSNLDSSYQYWMQELTQSRGEAVLLPTEQYISHFQSEKFAFTVVRKVMDRNLNQLGLIAIDAKINVIEDQMRELDHVTKGTSIIFDSKGHIIFDSKKQHMATVSKDDPILTKASLSKGSFTTSNGERMLHIYSSSNESDWKVITSIPVEQLTSETAVVKRIIWVTTATVVMLAIVVSIFLSYAITKPLRTMAGLMRRVQEGNFNVKFPVKYHDEVGLLGTQFNRMIVRLDELISHIYEMETKKNNAELQALQNQINPHFMYNTLETIRMNAEVNDDSVTADMIATLGKLLRYSISVLSSHTSLKDEIQHVQHYIELLNYRYPDRFTLSYHLNDQLARLTVTRLMLQPIVENAIYHGLDDNKDKMNITITFAMKQGDIEISIQDDGIGIEQEKLLLLNQKLNDSYTEQHNGQGTGGIGLKNVNERIKLQYGQNYGVKVFSNAGIGTIVNILLPAQRRELHV